MNLQTLNRKILYPNQGMGLTPFAYKKGGKVCYADGGEVEDDNRMMPMPERKGLSLAAMQPKEAGMIVGPGTGTSDSIPADLQEGSFILPANVVAYFGRDFVDALVGAQGPAEDEGGMVPAKVSNGEYHVPPEAVERIGEKALRAMIAAVQGNEQKSAEMDGQGRVKLAVGDDSEEQYRKALAAQNNGGQQGANQGANGVVPAAAIQTQKRVIDPINRGLASAGSAIQSGAGSINKSLFAVPESKPAPVAKTSLIDQANLRSGKTGNGSAVSGNTAFDSAPSVNNTAQKPQPPSLADQAKVQTQTTQPTIEKPKLNILGEPVQTLDSFGGYQVRGTDGSTAREIPFSASDDSALRRTLPADQYQNLQQQKRSFADQLANSVVAQSSSFEKSGRGYSSSSARGDFKPTLADFARGDNATALALEKMRQENDQFKANYDQKQRELSQPKPFVLDTYNPDTGEKTGQRIETYNPSGNQSSVDNGIHSKFIEALKQAQNDNERNALIKKYEELTRAK